MPSHPDRVRRNYEEPRIQRTRENMNRALWIDGQGEKATQAEQAWLLKFVRDIAE